MNIKSVQIIFYCKNQTKSKEFYSKLFRQKPILDVPGMTEFRMFDNLKLGLMPEDGIAKIISPKMPHPAKGTGIPRCELYIHTENIEFDLENAINSGAIIVDKLKNRDWGDRVVYLADFDGNIIAIAEELKN